MTYKFRPATEADASGLISVSMRCFAKDMANNAAFGRDPATNEYIPSVRSWMTKLSVEDTRTNLWKHKIVAVDENTGEIVAYASWAEPRTAEQMKEDQKRSDAVDEAYPTPEGVNGGFLKSCGDKRKKVMKELFGTDEEKDYWYLNYLGTLPSYEGRGIASKLIRWGFEKADAQGKKIFIESTPTAVTFYERHGCVKKGEMVLLDGDYRFHLMIREPKILN